MMLHRALFPACPGFLILTLSLLLLMGFTACKKDASSPTSEEVRFTESSVSLRDVEVLNDTLIYLCGGEPDGDGYIWKSTDGGMHWNCIHVATGRCLYDLDFFDPNNAFAGGDSLLILHTTDGGQHWTDVFAHADFSGWSEFIRPIRKMDHSQSDMIFAVGGDAWHKGLMMVSYNWGADWTNADFDNQLNDLALPDRTHALLCGYGIMLQSADSCRHTETVDMREDNFTGIAFRDASNGLACGYNGGIYRSNDGGLTWTEVLKSNGTFDTRFHLNDIGYGDGLSAFAVGNGGLLLYSSDDGSSWTRIRLEAENDLLSLCPRPGNTLWICGTEGLLLKVQP